MYSNQYSIMFTVVSGTFLFNFKRIYIFLSARSDSNVINSDENTLTQKCI